MATKKTVTPTEQARRDRQRADATPPQHDDGLDDVCIECREKEADRRTTAADPTLHAALNLMQALEDDPDAIGRAIMFISRVATHDLDLHAEICPAESAPKTRKDTYVIQTSRGAEAR
jgi:hypothetical protein